MVHAYAYCGFPRALRGLQTLVAVLDERKAKGIEDDWGRKASPITDTRSKYERGRDILVEISGIPADAPKADYAILAPEIEVFLKEHLFADLFERDVLTYAERELTTVAVIASLGKGVYHYFFKLAESHAVIQPVDKDDFQFVEVTLTRKGCDLCNVLSFTVHSLFCFRCLGGYDSASEEDTE